MLDSFAFSDLLQDFGDLVRLLGRRQNRDWPADHLFGGVAISALRSLVPRCDDAAQGLANDGIVRGIYNRGQEGPQIPPRGAAGNGCGRSTPLVLLWQSLT